MRRLLFVLGFFLIGYIPLHSKPSVLVTVAPYADLVQRIAGDILDIAILVPPDANPHVYEPTPKEFSGFLQVSAWFRTGEQSEKKTLNTLRAHNPQLPVIDLSCGLDLISSPCAHGHASYDFHTWMSPLYAKIQAQEIAKTLEAIFPQHRELFTRNLETLLHDLSGLEKKIRTELLPFKDQTILVSHPAFGYYCREFQLKQLSLEFEGKEPLPQDVERVAAKAKASGVTVVLVERQYSDKGARILAAQLGLTVYTVDPYARDYIHNLEHITECLLKGFGGSRR